MTEELKKYNKIFIEFFGKNDSDLNKLAYKITAEWNSMTQIAIVSELEETFNIDFGMEDIFALISYEKGKELLRSKFGINL